MTQLINGEWNPTQIIGMLLAGGFALGMVYAIVAEVLQHIRRRRK